MLGYLNWILSNIVGAIFCRPLGKVVRWIKKKLKL